MNDIAFSIRASINHKDHTLIDRVDLDSPIASESLDQPLLSGLASHVVRQVAGESSRAKSVYGCVVHVLTHVTEVGASHRAG